MKYSTIVPAALSASLAYAAPGQQKRQDCAPVQLSGSENPFLGRTMHANDHYGDYVRAAAQAISDPALAAAAEKVADVPTFLWLDTISTIPTFEEHLQKTGCDEIFPVVIYDLPGRDCAAKASNGELAVGEVERYKTEYIDPIVAILKANPNIAVVALVEPDSLPNLVTNIDLVACQNSEAGYREGVAYALEQLNLPNVVTYLDAGHGGWLGWNDNIAPGAEVLASAYKAAGSPENFRGISTNVAGWNAWEMTPGEFENLPDGQYNKAHDEKRYVTVFGAALAAAGMPNHAIVDTGRNAVQGLRLAWGDWCNVDGAGFGVRPTTDTGLELADAFVWVKPGGESDGTSDTSAVRYDSFCGNADAFKPSPEAGQWNQEYFEMLLENASPAF